GRNGKTIYYGMVGKVFALSNDPSRLAQIASSPTQAVSGAKGAISLNADAGQIVSQLVAKAAGGGLGGAFGGSVVSAPLGSLTGWANSSTSGISGHLKLQIKYRRGGGPLAPSVPAAQERKRVEWMPADGPRPLPDLEVEVRAGGLAG